MGLGASGYEGNIRYTNTRNLDRYLKDYSAKEYEEEVTLEDDKTYYLMTNLRTRYGVNLDEYKKRFNEDLYVKNKEYFVKLIKEGFISYDNQKNTIICEYKGMMTLDQILLNIL